MFSFDSPWKYQGSFSHVFREDEKETIEKNVLNDKLCIISIICLLHSVVILEVAAAL